MYLFIYSLSGRGRGGFEAMVSRSRQRGHSAWRRFNFVAASSVARWARAPHSLRYNPLAATPCAPFHRGGSAMGEEEDVAKALAFLRMSMPPELHGE